MKLRLALFISTISIAAVHAAPVNLVSNPSFDDYVTETVTDPSDPRYGDIFFKEFTDWDSTPIASNVGAIMAPEPNYIHSGDAAAFIQGGNFSQVLPTVAGHNYEIAFWYRDPPLPPSVLVKKTGTTPGQGDCARLYGFHDDGVLRLLFGGTQIFASPQTQVQTDPIACYQENGPDIYTLITLHALGTGNDELKFVGSMEATDSAWFMDDVSVTDITPVPEPAALALAMGGLAGLAALRRRKRRKD